MSGNTKIEWTNKTWSPIRARVKPDAPEIARARGWADLVEITEKMVGRVGPHCEQVSPGCHNCYSKTNNHRCLPSNGTGLPFDRRSRDLVDVFLDEKALLQPLIWRKPCKIFVENQSDLFGEFVPDELVDQVFAVMALASRHTFQVLTKRAERMRDHIGGSGLRSRIATEANAFMRGHRWNSIDEDISHFLWSKFTNAEVGEFVWYLSGIPDNRWPLPNVWLGVSCEDQQRADERIPLLLQTPAAVRFVSAEPLLGPISFDFLETDETGKVFWCHDPSAPHPCEYACGFESRGLDWAIVGGESGPGARPMDVEWARSIVRQCRAAQTPVFVKQLGAKPFGILNGATAGLWSEHVTFSRRDPEGCAHIVDIRLDDPKGGNPAEWPSDLRVREFPRMAVPTQ